MTQAQEYRKSGKMAARVPRKKSGFSMIEVIFALLVSIILAAIAVPGVGSVLNYYHLSGRSGQRDLGRPIHPLSGFDGGLSVPSGLLESE